MRRSRIWLLIGVGLVFGIAAGCRVGADDLEVTAPNRVGDAGVAAEELPVVGPIPGASHWHAAYVVRVCDDVLPPLESDADPLGIHSHGDGVMHVHPFFASSGYENATLGLFADAVGLGLSDGELALPGGGVWRDGDLCGDTPGRVFVDRWPDPDPESAVERHFEGLADLRYLADGELYQIAFAPADSPPVVPPSFPLLTELSVVVSDEPEPWVDVDPASTLEQTRVWAVASVAAGPCTGEQVPERVRAGDARCFERADDPLQGRQAIGNARAVVLNRRPAVELRITPTLRSRFEAHFAASAEPMVLAIEIDGAVITAPRLERLPVSEDRLVISGGLTVETAEQLARVLAG